MNMTKSLLHIPVFVFFMFEEAETVHIKDLTRKMMVNYIINDKLMINYFCFLKYEPIKL